MQAGSSFAKLIVIFAVVIFATILDTHPGVEWFWLGASMLSVAMAFPGH